MEPRRPTPWYRIPFALIRQAGRTAAAIRQSKSSLVTPVILRCCGCMMRDQTGCLPVLSPTFARAKLLFAARRCVPIIAAAFFFSGAIDKEVEMQRRNWVGGLLVVLGMGVAAITSYIGPAAPALGEHSLGSGNSQEGIRCYFSPDGGCTEAVVEEINNAQQSILMQAYSFTSAPIAKALVEAHNRGVQITAILDKSQRTEQYSSADFILHADIPTYIDDKHAIAHNKIMLIDGRTIITGSFNFTKQAEHANAENLLILTGKSVLFSAYEANFRRHLDHSTSYAGRGEGQAEATTKRRKR
jgi:PLD-like domain